jgi:hypothetical protein
VARWCVAAFGAGGLALGATMFVVPSAVIPAWPWPLTPLTCRVVGAIFVLAGAAVGVLRDARWVRLRLLAEVEVVMVALMVVAALRAHGEFIGGRPMGWLLVLGAVVALGGAVALMVTFRGAPDEPAYGREEATPHTR